MDNFPYILPNQVGGSSIDFATVQEILEGANSEKAINPSNFAAANFKSDLSKTVFVNAQNSNAKDTWITDGFNINDLFGTKERPFATLEGALNALKSQQSTLSRWKVYVLSDIIAQSFFSVVSGGSVKEIEVFFADGVRYTASGSGNFAIPAVLANLGNANITLIGENKYNTRISLGGVYLCSSPANPNILFGNSDLNIINLYVHTNLGLWDDQRGKETLLETRRLNVDNSFIYADLDTEGEGLQFKINNSEIVGDWNIGSATDFLNNIAHKNEVRSVFHKGSLVVNSPLSNPDFNLPDANSLRIFDSTYSGTAEGKTVFDTGQIDFNNVRQNKDFEDFRVKF